MGKRTNSLKLNMILNAVKGMLGIIFPLISFPYVSKVLGVGTLGKYNFSTSIINYFVLIAGLGISTYAIREGAKLRDDRKEFGSFANEMLSINVISTVVAYVLLGIVLITVPKMTAYCLCILILSIQIAFMAVGVEWLYSVYEDYLFITIRSIIFYCISLGLLFLLVHDEKDLNLYCLITVISSVGSSIMNFLHARKYCSFRLTTKIHWKRHIKPIMILFAMQIATTIYISSDTTILGFMCTDETVGIYSVSTKIYTVVKTILASILIVSVPRLSSLLGQDRKEEFAATAEDIYATLLTFVIPAIVGLIVMRKEIILFISDKDYLQATSSLSLLCIALLFCLGAWFWGQCILVPQMREAFVFKVTLISAVINIVLNFIMIPVWAENAAAFTTVAAEGVAFIMQRHAGRKYVRFQKISRTLIKVLIGCLPIAVSSILLKVYIKNNTVYLLSVVFVSAIAYFALEILMKNESIYNVKNFVKKK